MRPEVYARALLAALTQTGESAQVRLVWIQSMGGALGGGLAVNYRSLSRMLRDAGVVPAGYLVVEASDGVSGGSAQTGLPEPAARRFRASSSVGASSKRWRSWAPGSVRS